MGRICVSSRSILNTLTQQDPSWPPADGTPSAAGAQASQSENHKGVFWAPSGWPQSLSLDTDKAPLGSAKIDVQAHAFETRPAAARGELLKHKPLRSLCTRLAKEHRISSVTGATLGLFCSAGGSPCNMFPRTGSETNLRRNKFHDSVSRRFHGRSDRHLLRIVVGRLAQETQLGGLPI